MSQHWYTPEEYAEVKEANTRLEVANLQLKADNEKLREAKAEQYQLAQYYRAALQEIRDRTPANCYNDWPHHHWYLAKATEAINHKLTPPEQKP